MSLTKTGIVVETLQGGNRLIDRLPHRQRRAFLDQCEHVELPLGTVLCEAGEPFKYAYFPTAGNISLVKTLDGHQPFETESIGREGMLGTTLILQVNYAPQRGVVQGSCQAIRITANQMMAALADQPALGRVLHRYLYFILAELLQTTGCIRYHDISQRLAGVLLLAHDRAPGDQLPLTHQLLADMLGVQRGAVTIAAIKLQQEGTIRYSRGRISILHRQGLESAACGCYNAKLASYASLLW